MVFIATGTGKTSVLIQQHIGTMFDLKPCYSCTTRLDPSSQFIWVYPNVSMCSIKPNVEPHMCLIHALASAHETFDPCLTFFFGSENTMFTWFTHTNSIRCYDPEIIVNPRRQVAYNSFISISKNSKRDHFAPQLRMSLVFDCVACNC